MGCASHTKNMVSTNQLVECLEVLWTGLLKLKHDRSSLVFYKALFTCRPEKLESCLEVQAITNGGVLTLVCDLLFLIMCVFDLYNIHTGGG